jgi:hypothetical protein
VTTAAGVIEALTACLLTLGVARAGAVSFATALIWIVVAGVVAGRLEWRNSSPRRDTVAVPSA